MCMQHLPPRLRSQGSRMAHGSRKAECIRLGVRAMCGVRFLERWARREPATDILTNTAPRVVYKCGVDAAGLPLNGAYI